MREAAAAVGLATHQDVARAARELGLGAAVKNYRPDQGREQHRYP